MRSRVRPPLVSRALSILAAGALLLATGVATADTEYKIQPIVKFGDSVAGINIKVNGGQFGIAGLTDRGQSAFSTWVAELPTGEALIQYADGKFTPVIVAGREGPVGTCPKDLVGYAPDAMNQLGNMVFTDNSWNNGDPTDLGTFLWDAQSQKVIPVARADAPGGGKFALIVRAWVNDKNRNVLIVARINDPGSGPLGLYLWADGTLTSVAVRGQEMPGGGQFKESTLGQYGVSPPNGLGQHAFIATLSDGSTAAYLMDGDGKLSLILKSGAVTELGKITRIGRGALPPGISLAQGGSGIGLNRQGQVALPVQIDGAPSPSCC